MKLICEENLPANYNSNSVWRLHNRQGGDSNLIETEEMIIESPGSKALSSRNRLPIKKRGRRRYLRLANRQKI